MKVVVNFIISDTWADHIPENKAMGGTRPDLGTEMAYQCSSIKKAVELANKLIHLTTGNRGTVFDYSKVVKAVRLGGCKRWGWSNSYKTHHCELLFDGEWTHYTTGTKKG